MFSCMLHRLFRKATNHWYNKQDKPITSRFVELLRGMPRYWMVQITKTMLKIQLQEKPERKPMMIPEPRLGSIDKHIAYVIFVRTTTECPKYEAFLMPILSHRYALRLPAIRLPRPKKTKHVAILVSLLVPGSGRGSKCDSELDTKPIVRPDSIEAGKINFTCLKYLMKFTTYPKTDFYCYYRVLVYSQLKDWLWSRDYGIFTGMSGMHSRGIGNAPAAMQDKSRKQSVQLPMPSPTIVISGARISRELLMKLNKLISLPLLFSGMSLQYQLTQSPLTMPKMLEANPPMAFARSSKENLRVEGSGMVQPSGWTSSSNEKAVGMSKLTRYPTTQQNSTLVDFMLLFSSMKAQKMQVTMEVSELAVRQASPQPLCRYF